MKNYFKHKMRTKTPGVIAGCILLGIIAIVGFAILFGFIIMWLWNALMPDLFGLVHISYWQAVGLFVLSKILFGGFGGGSGKSSSSKKKYECDDNKKSDFSKWELYDKFWEEEGDMAYKDYLKRTNGGDSEE